MPYLERVCVGVGALGSCVIRTTALESPLLVCWLHLRSAMKNRGLIVRYGQVAIVSALAAALSLGSSACGPPRAEEYEFEEDDCGDLARPRDPSPAPDTRGAMIRGVAERVDDDPVSVTLAPLVSVEANAVVDWTADGVTVRGNASATAELACELELVADVAEAKPVDIVFVLDTT